MTADRYLTVAGRRVDVVLGVLTGLFTYYLHETHPRTARPSGHTLPDLVRWKYRQMYPATSE